MADDVRLGFVGLGRWGTVLAEAAQRTGRINVAAAFARGEAARSAFGERFGAHPCASVEELFGSEIDGVVIATPHSTHARLVTEAAQRGLPVFVEKPFTLSVESARDCIAAVEKAGVPLQVGHHRRRLPATRALARLHDEGRIGMVQLLNATLSAPVGFNPPRGWGEDPTERPLGSLTALGVHMVDTLNYLVGRPARVSAFGARVLGHSNLDDVTTVMIEYESGPLATIATSFTIPRIATVAMHGTEASAWSTEDGTRLTVQLLGETSPSEQAVGSLDVHADQMNEFADVIQGLAKPEVGAAEALEVVLVLEACLRSAREGRAVDVDELRQA